MKNNRIHIAKHIWVNLCRFLLAGLFIFSGFVKAVDPLGTQYKIEDYLSAFGMTDWFPAFFPLLFSVILSTLEFSVGVLLFFGVRKRASTTLAFLMMLVMTPLTLYLAVTNPVSDCGCFGDAWVLTNWQTFWKNVVLLVAAASVFAGRARIIRFVTAQTEWLVSLYTVLYILVFSSYCIRNLPVIDFRPYKIGKSITEGMSIPPGAKPSVFETRFILEKNGERKEFTLENYPDSTWTFIDSRSILKEKGYEPAIHDFSITTETGDDITDIVLEDEGITYFIVMYDLAKTNTKNLAAINQLYEEQTALGAKFYALTASYQGDIDAFKAAHHTPYQFCTTDPITLKTMVRANPGIMVLKKGTILDKYNSNCIQKHLKQTNK